MFGMGMNEVFIVIAIAVIVIGPKQLPQVARTMGKMVAQFKRATNDLRNTISDEVNEHVPLDEINEFRDTLNSGVQDLQNQSRSLVHGEFEDDKKIGGEIANDLKAAYSEIPTEKDFLTGNGGDPQPRKRIAAKGGKKTRAVAAGSKTTAAGSKTPVKKIVNKPASAKRPSDGMARGESVKGKTVKKASAKAVVARSASKTADKSAAKSRQGRRA